MPEKFCIREQFSVPLSERQLKKIYTSDTTGMLILDELKKCNNTLKNIETILQRIDKTILLDKQSL